MGSWSVEHGRGIFLNTPLMVQLMTQKDNITVRIHVVAMAFFMTKAYTVALSHRCYGEFIAVHHQSLVHVHPELSKSQMKENTF